MEIKGYKKRPLLITIFAFVYLLNPIGNIVFQFVVNGAKNNDYSFFNFLNTLYQKIFVEGNIYVITNILLWLVGIVVAIGLFRVRLWAWYLFIIHSALMFILSFWNSPSQSIQFSAMSFVNLAFMLPIGVFLTKEIRTPYFNPRVRWWEQNKRVKESIDIILNGASYKTYDISKSGFFILMDNPDKYQVGGNIDVEIKLGSKVQFPAKLEILWISHKTASYPVGFGAKFLNLDKGNANKIYEYIKNEIKSGVEKIRG